ncbi:hypothetical protein NXW71_08625 [Parabacteroides merdae]|nr:hypothetical protein [Parabacteroides merdae]
MEQKLLHKMFNGEATDNELTQIRQWVNADKMNRETFYHERALFDALQLNAFQKGNHVRKQSVPLPEMDRKCCRCCYRPILII